MARISTSAPSSPAKRGRGRPPKNAPTTSAATPAPVAPSTPTKKSLPGRPKKSNAIEDIAAEEGLGPVVSPRKSRNADKPALASEVAPSAAPAARTSPRTKTVTAEKGGNTNGAGSGSGSTYRGRGRPRKSDGKTAAKTQKPALNRVKSGRVGRPRKNASTATPPAATRTTPKRVGRPPKATSTANTIAAASKAKTTTSGRIGRPPKNANGSVSSTLAAPSKSGSIDAANFNKLVATVTSLQAELLSLRATVNDHGIDAAAVEQRLDHVEDFLSTEMNMAFDGEAEGVNGDRNTNNDADIDDDEIEDAQSNANHLPIPTLVINGSLLGGGEDLEIDVVQPAFDIQVRATQEASPRTHAHINTHTQTQTFSTAAEEDAAMLDEDFINDDDEDEAEEQIQANELRGGVGGDAEYEEDGPLGPVNPKAQSLFGSVMSAVQGRLSSPGRGASPGRMMSPGR